MAKVSAGLLMYRYSDATLQVLLVHPGGPYWRKKDEGAWSIPKGELGDEEDALDAAVREFEEETGIAPGSEFFPLGQVEQKGGKKVIAWAFEGDCDPGEIVSNTFPMEWPPKSGVTQEFPEIDRAEFFRLSEARIKINSAQAALLDVLELELG